MRRSVAFPAVNFHSSSTNMIPPCDPSILEQNPKFKRLYENLTVNLLNSDCSTRAYSAEPTRAAIAEDLKQCQIQDNKKRIKLGLLKQLAFASDSEVPHDCHDNLAIISLYLETPTIAIEPESSTQISNQNATGQPTDNALSLLAPEIETFYKNLPSLSLHLSTLISDAIADLRAISNTDTNPDLPNAQDASQNPSRMISTARVTSNHYIRSRERDRRVRTSMAPVPHLASQLRERVRNLRRVQLSELPAARREMAATAAALLAVQTLVLERMVVILERAKHGALARATKAKAEHLATVSQGIEGKLEVTKLEIAAMLYTPETLAALGRYQSHLQDARMKLDDRRNLARKELSRYGDVEESEELSDRGVSDGGTLVEIARRYGNLLREVEMVKMEIARIGE